MATRGPLRPLAHLLQTRPIHLTPRRTFLSNLLPSDNNKPLTINVTRTLPYPRAALYDLIVDVDSYSTFLPFCSHSRVTAWSAPDPTTNGTRWPTEGELTVGYGPVVQSYTSRIVCVPGKSVEALSGNEEHAVAAKDGGKNPFKQLVTKWTVEDAPAPRVVVGDESGESGENRDWTRVDLDMRLRLEDPFLQMMLAKVAGETAEKMIEAFEKRVRESFGPGR